MIKQKFDKIKNYGAKIHKEGDGIQLIKATGTVGTNDTAQHLIEARNNSKKRGEDGTVQVHIIIRQNIRFRRKRS